MKKFFRKHYKIISVLLLFVLAISLRVNSMGDRFVFGWDQVDNAWAAKNILINHEYPLVGMVAKQNTGFFIGPAYYYFVGIFYWITNLNPAASQYIAIITAVFTFFTIFFVTKKLFSFKFAFLAIAVNSLTIAGYFFDSVQWPVGFLPAISLIIFYSLYKIMIGEEKFILLLAVMMGIAFNLHFTAVFFPIIILLTLPFFPRNKKTFYYLLLSVPLFFIWLLPNIIYQIGNHSQMSNVSNYLGNNYHGLHLRRLIQLISDGFIQFDPYLFYDQLKSFKVLVILFFFFVFLKDKTQKNKIIFSYLALIFFLVPWIVFSTYRGEISDYYFSINRYIALILFTYIFSKLLFSKKLIPRIVALIIFSFYLSQNIIAIQNFGGNNGLNSKVENVKRAIGMNHKIEFQQGVPESYIYYYLMREKGVSVY